MANQYDFGGSQLTLVSQSKCFGGDNLVYRHASRACAADMAFGIYLPPQAEQRPCPVVYWLSGLTCSEQNFLTKAGAQKYAAELGLILVAPDTSPRDLGLPGENKDWDLGSGAGFYVNATMEPWSRHYKMYDYVTGELPDLLHAHFPVDAQRASLAGHSMGGHGALVAGLKERGRYRSISAFAPICAPSQVPWGEKAFGAYLGHNRERWRDYDAVALLARGPIDAPILVDQGTEDRFLAEQLRPDLLVEAAKAVGQSLTYREQPGYDHSYYFIATFIEDHLNFHSSHLAK